MSSSYELEVHVCHLQKKIGNADAIVGQKEIALRHANENAAEARERYHYNRKNLAYMMKHADVVDLDEYKETLKLLALAKQQYESFEQDAARLRTQLKVHLEERAELEAELEATKAELAHLAEVVPLWGVEA